MSLSRRSFVKTGMYTSVAAAGALIVPRPLKAYIDVHPEPVPPIQDPRLRQLTQAALDAALSAGASYADVRLSHERTRAITPGGIGDGEALSVGVRALVNGYWGYASSPQWNASEMARLGHVATQLAKTNAKGKPRVVDFAPIETLATGHWETPVQIDPFTVHPIEIQDWMNSVTLKSTQIPHVTLENTIIRFTFSDIKKAFASTDGSYCTQRLIQTDGEFSVGWRKENLAGNASLNLTPAGIGWEVFDEDHMLGTLHRNVELAIADASLPVKPLEAGRYDTILDAVTVASILDRTVGAASEIDRALGYEANAGGTSYLSEPLNMLDTFKVGSSLLTVSADRNQAQGAATVGWDDEGVTPKSFTIVKDGILTNYQTTRESAGWLRAHSEKTGHPIQSHGCAQAPSALEPAIPHTANLVMASAVDLSDFDTLTGNIEKGISIRQGTCFMDFQQLNGLVRGIGYEIKSGKRVARFFSCGLLFKAPEFWSNLSAIGGPDSIERYGLRATKGQPPQSTYHSVTSVPVIVTNCTIVDPLRKA
jgi:TldD protein